jgi:selenocysteine lyase/cysteine desulfurase
VLRHGVQFIRSIGLPAIESRVQELSTHCLQILKNAGLKTMTPDPWEERAQIVNVLVPDAEQVMNALREKHRVIVNVKDDAIRISMGFFNTEEDLEKAVSAIARETRGAKVAAA